MNKENSFQELIDNDKVLIQTGLTTGQMIDVLKVGDRAKTETTDSPIWVEKILYGAIIVIENATNEESVERALQINPAVLENSWTVYRKFISFYDAMKAHEEEKKTITYHQSKDLTYTFKHELETGQFKDLSNDNLCLYELIEGNWTIDD
ncbi:hypothetical protein CVD28_00835 [Bacillus sp. M6-12]|uniref:hypothetical protein n=1 Tax=Bacillus sp. M6-12 TaxID=2054166 RepID=UPI000C7594FC|nr:hypothetical protein [Bacillus sp. M6-12]PLS18979.1 hypothetical protein CVD28_00835 [Bacillus sp. M6-12]